MQQFIKFKGKPNLFHKLEVLLHGEILISLPILFNFEDTTKSVKDELRGSILRYINILAIEFRKIKSDFTTKCIKNMLKSVWPILIYKVDPQKFKQHVQFLKKELELTPQHASLMINYSYKFSSKYPAFCRQTTLQVFQIQEKDLSNNLLLDPLIGEQCLEAYMQIDKFEVCSEITLAQQNEFIQQEFKPSLMSFILQKLLHRKTNVIKLVNSLSKDIHFISKFDHWLSTDVDNKSISMWRTLKLILSIEALFEIKCKSAQDEVKAAGLSVVYEAADRLVSKLFSYNYKETILVLDWILQSKIWAESNQLKNKLIHHLITCYEIQCRKPQNVTPFHKKIQNCQTELIKNYIHKIKLKHFPSTNFRTKVPKSYLSANLRLLQNASTKQENDSYAIKIGTSTISLSKGNGTESLDKQALQVTSINSKTSSLDKLLVSITKYTQNLQLSKIYIIALIIQQQLHKQQTQQEQTDTQINQPLVYKYGNLYRKIYYLIIKAIQSYQQIFKANILSVEIMKIVCTFATKFVDGNIREIHHTQWVDLQIINGNQLVLQNLSSKILANKIYYRLQTIYQMEQAQNIYDKQNSQNSKPMSIKDIQNKKITKLDKFIPKPSRFKLTIYEMMASYANKSYQFDLLQSLICVSDAKVHHTLLLNMVFYTLAKRMRPKHQEIRELTYIQTLLIKLFNFYLQPQLRQQHKKIVQLLTKGHKIMDYWSRCTRRSLHKIQGSITQSLPLRGTDLQKFVAKKYWKLLVSSANSNSDILKKYAKRYEQFNCIKQSIYLIELANNQDMFSQQKLQQAGKLYDLFARLESNLNNSKPYIFNELRQNSKDKTIKWEKKQQQKSYNQQAVNSDFEYWYKNLKYLTEYPTLHLYCKELSKLSHQLCSLQDPEQLNKILNEVCVFSTYYQSLQQKNYSKIQSIMGLYSHRNINLSIVHCLKSTKKHIKRKNNVPQHLEGLEQSMLMELVPELSNIIYAELVRLDQISILQKEVESVPVEDKSKEQLKIAIIVYHRLKQYNKVRVHFRQVSKRFKEMRPQLQFYNIQASIKSIAYYPSQEMIESLNKIITYIESEKQASKIDKKFTEPLFETFKFMCSNYKNLTLEEQRKVLTYLNRYLNKCLSVRNHILSKQACYFILRFILLQSKSTEQLCSEPSTFEVSKYGASIMEPHLPLLISSIGDNDKINQFIKNVLVKIAQNDPKASVWWIYALKNHCRAFKGMDTNKRHPYDEIDKNIQKLGENIYGELKRKLIDLDSELNWIDWFISVGPDDKLEKQKVPSGMVSPFSKQMIIEKITSVYNVGSGKSKPVMIQMKVNIKKGFKVINFIRKISQNCKSGFRTESATANFFKDSAILDPYVTYSIIHLSKYCILLEYVQNKSTLDKLMTSDIQRDEEPKLRKLATIKESILGKTFDQPESHIRFNLSKFFYEDSSVSQWWIKYTNFIRTYAQWSFFCYIVGLGDRHTNNVLVTEEGKVIQIDFQYILDIGKLLPYPQWVPFRLTRGLLYQLSIVEPYGLLFSQFVETANRYKEKQRQIWHALSHFSYLKKKNVPELINQRAQLDNQFYEKSLNLFKEATDSMLLRDMFKGWASYK